MLLDTGQEFGNRDAQTSGYRKRSLNCEVVFPAFDAAHIGSVEPAVVRKRLLREALLPAKLADTLAEHDL